MNFKGNGVAISTCMLNLSFSLPHISTIRALNMRRIIFRVLAMMRTLDLSMITHKYLYVNVNMDMPPSFETLYL